MQGVDDRVGAAAQPTDRNERLEDNQRLLGAGRGRFEAVESPCQIWWLIGVRDTPDVGRGLGHARLSARSLIPNSIRRIIGKSPISVSRNDKSGAAGVPVVEGSQSGHEWGCAVGSLAEMPP